MRQVIRGIVLITVLLGSSPQVAYSQDTADARLDQITNRIDHIESRLQNSVKFVVLFLFGSFCALWAQNTNRNAWLWFFLGLFFHVITVLVLLAKNSGDCRQARGEPARGATAVTAAVILGALLTAGAAVWLLARPG